ncbi:MAG: hypothetical protein ACK526_01025 [Planctomyces sp.]|jgi:hypothetical protein
MSQATETAPTTRRKDPTLEEIAAARLEIQATWSDDERMKRMRSDWRASFRRCDGVNEDMELETYSQHHIERERLQEVAKR